MKAHRVPTGASFPRLYFLYVEESTTVDQLLSASPQSTNLPKGRGIEAFVCTKEAQAMVKSLFPRIGRSMTDGARHVRVLKRGLRMLLANYILANGAWGRK